MKSEKRISRICKIPAMAVLTLALSILIVMIPAKVAHASGTVRFGSATYTTAANTDFQVGVYIETTDEVPLGAYSVNIIYDPNLLTYVAGAETGGDGNLLVMGASLDGKQGMHMLTFHANGTPGDTALTVTGAIVNDTTGVAMEVGGLPAAPITIQTPTTRMPEYLRVNDKEVAGLTEGQTEYTFSIPYAESFTVEAPEGFTVTAEYPEEPHTGRNNITVVLTQPNANPLTLTLHANMEPKEEEVVEPEPEPVSEPVSEVTSESTELPMEPVITSEEITTEPEEIASEPTSEGKTTREGGFPPNNQIHYVFKTSDLLWIGGCILGALLLFVLILLIVNGRSVGNGGDEDDEEYEDEEEKDLDDGWEPLDMDTPPARPVKKAEPEKKESARKDSNRKDSERNDSDRSESGKKSSKKEGGRKSDDTKTGDDLVAATYKKDSKKAVGDEIVAATYKKGAKKNDSEDTDEVNDNKRAKDERAREKEERTAEKEERAREKEQAKEERLKEKEERAREKEEREAEKEERAQAKEQEKEERLKEKEERAREKEEREAEKEERAREKAEREKAKELAKEEQARAKAEREKAKEAARAEQARAKEERAKAKAKEPEYYVDDATGELTFLPLNYTEEDLKGITNADEEDNIVGTAELVRSEEIADFDDDMADAISAATENEIKETAKAKAEESEAVAHTRAILAGKEAASAEPFAKTLIMDPAELQKQLLKVTEDDPRYKGGAEEYEAYDDEEEDEEWEDEDGFIDLESSVSDRKSKH